MVAGLGKNIDLKDFQSWLAAKIGEFEHLDLNPLLEKCGLEMVAQAKERFDSGKAPDGEPWKPLQRPRIRSGGNDLPLRDRGLLAASMSAGVGHVERQTRDSIEVGTNLEYAATHQYGAVISAKRGKFLAIPLTRESARSSARNYKGELFFRKAGSAAFLSESTGSGALVNRYLLLKSVTIPARPFMGFSEENLEDLQEVVATHLEDLLLGELP